MKARSIFALITTSLLAACGGGGDTDNADNVDADNADVDAAPEIDATPENIATELGKVCTGAPGECPADASQCVAFVEGATSGLCTLECGTSTDAMMPPAGGDALCAAQYDGTSGTPACLGTAPPVEGTYTWLCLVGCGIFTQGEQSIDLGSCPNDMTCTDNICN
jgi:hypothetical protein